MRLPTRFLGLLVGPLALAAVGFNALPADAGDITTCPPGEDCHDAPIMDAQIAAQYGGAYVGVGEYDESGADELVAKNIKPGKTKSFYLRSVNVGDEGDVQWDGTGSSPCFRIRYYGGAWDFTSYVVNGTLAGAFGAGDTLDLRLDVKAKACAVPGNVATTLLDVSPTTGGLDHDRVRARVTVIP
jgi:hypothetical protein